MRGCVNTRYKRLERPPRASPPPQPRVSGFTGSWQLRSAPSALLLRRAGTGLPSQTSLEIPATRHPPPRQRLETLRGPLHRGRTLLVRREPGLGVSPGGRTRTAVPTAASHRAAGGASAGEPAQAAATWSCPRDKGLLSCCARRRRPPSVTETSCDPTQIFAPPLPFSIFACDASLVN